MSEQSVVATAPYDDTPRRPSVWRALLDIERFGLVYVWLVLLVAFSFDVPFFFRLSTFQIVLGSQATQIVVTLAVVIGLLGGEFDFSVSSVVAVSGLSTVVLNADYGLPIAAVILIVLLAAFLFGALNAFISIRIGVPSIVATLGSGTLLMGLATGWAGSAPKGGVDMGFVGWTSLPIFGLPLAIYFTFGIGLVMYYVLDHTPVGRRFVFAGQNPEVARLSGIRVERLRAGALIWSSLLSAVAGILLVGITGASVPAVAGGYLLPAFAGAFLGSTVIRPGRFNVPGVFIASYFLVSGVTGLQLLGYTGWINDVFYGASLVLAVVVTRLVSQHNRKKRNRL
ncbi:MAG: hypothetical protein RLZZ444_183 [Pseudomonadota bacterium]|jgi:ribose transport system permease protein